MVSRKVLWTVVTVAAMATPALAQYPYPPQYPPPYPSADPDDAKCRSWGAMPGTQAYFECRATLDRDRGGQPPWRPDPTPWGPDKRPRDQNVSDKDAISYCESRARMSAPYPIQKLASKLVVPGEEKRVGLSFQVIKPGAPVAFWNVECKFRQGKMTAFNAQK